MLEPLQLGDGEPQPATLASLDPRVQANANGHLPYQVGRGRGGLGGRTPDEVLQSTWGLGGARGKGGSGGRKTDVVGNWTLSI